MRIGEQIRKEREARGLSREALSRLCRAKGVPVSARSILRIEQGHENAQFSTVLALCKVLRIARMTA